MYKIALKILTKLNNMGYEAYIVGGFARDKYLGVFSNDIDICTSATPDTIKKYFKIIKDNSKFGSVIIKENNFEYEITTFREDRYQDSRYPKVSFVKDLEKDLERRDFIINTLCIDKNGDYVDKKGAIYDLDHKIITCVGNPNIKFNEDPIRILRAIRFASKLGFSLSDDINYAIDKQKSKLKNLSKSKISLETDKILRLKNGKNMLKKFDLEDILYK